MKNYELCLLFDCYGALLTDKQRELFDLYYNEDLSLAEISEHAGITRQGVRDGIVRAEHTLRAMEERLGLVARLERITAHTRALTDELSAAEALARGGDGRMSELLARMRGHLAAIEGEE